MRFVPYYKLDGIPNIAVDGSAHQDSKIVLSHWIDSGTSQSFMRDTSAQIVLDFLKNKNKVPDGVEAVSNDHFDQDGLVGVFSLIEQSYSLKHYDFLIDIATSGDFGKYKDRNAARVSMALAKMVHSTSEIIPEEVYKKPYPEMAAVFYQTGIEMLPKFVDNINEFKSLWQDEDNFLSECERYIADGTILIKEYPGHDLAVIVIPADLPEKEFHRFTVIKMGPIHDMALHNATKMGRLIYSYAGKLHFRYRYETWVQLENNCHPLRVGLEKLAAVLSEKDGAEWKYQGSDKLVPVLERADKGKTQVSVNDFRTMLINTFNTEEVDWNPYSS